MNDQHGQHDTADDTAVCVIGSHRYQLTTDDTGICGRHLARVRDQLDGVARMTAQLTHHLVPGSSPGGEKVATTRVGSPTSARLDVLSLLAPGGREIRRDARMLAPQVRRWSSVHTYDVIVSGPDGEPTTERRILRDWHSELVTDTDGQPVKIIEDDQIGQLPPAEWMDEWVRRWRLALHHTTSPIKGRVSLACDTDRRRRLHRAEIAEGMRIARGVPALLPAVRAFIVAGEQFRAHLATARSAVRLHLLGVSHDGPTHQARVAEALAGGGALAQLGPLEVLRDATTIEWEVRYGATTAAATTAVDAKYLADWVELAAGTDGADLPAFAAELSALHAELQHVLGFTGDEQWLGRCPALLRNRDGNETRRPCGYGLWQDPYRTTVECPRCHTGWPQANWLGLAQLIRERWPIDRRRRYTQSDRRIADEAKDYLPKCRGCERVLNIEWREITGRRERTRYWTPARLVCLAGCLSGGIASATAGAA